VRKKRPYVAVLSELTITREGNEVIIAYNDPEIMITHLTVGPRLRTMTDQEILDLWNALLVAQTEHSAENPYVAIEIPPGRPQIEYHEDADQWVPRGGIVRCVIDDGGPDGEVTVHVDETELSLRDFGRMLQTYAGWGMRIVFVPEEEIETAPSVELGEPDEPTGEDPPR